MTTQPMNQGPESNDTNGGGLPWKPRRLDTLESVSIELAICLGRFVKAALREVRIEDPVLLKNEAEESDVDTLITIEQGAKLMGVSKSWIYEHREELPFVKQFPGGMRRISLADLRDYVRTGGSRR